MNLMIGPDESFQKTKANMLVYKTQDYDINESSTKQTERIRSELKLPRKL
jgi:hypothetical protein